MFYHILIILSFKTLKVISEQKLIWFRKDIGLVLDKDKSSFLTYKTIPGVYTFKDLSEVLSRKSQLEFDGFKYSIDIEINDNTMKTKLIVRFDIIALRCDGKSYFNTILGFTLHWDFKHYNEDIRQKYISLSTTDKIHLKCDILTIF